jgi:general secretion pathway protein G
MLHEALQPYLKNRGVFQCPSDTGTKLLDNHPDQDFITSPSMFRAYGSSYLFRTEIAFRFLTQTSFQLPSDINVLFDGAGHWHGDGRALQKEDTQDPQTYFGLIRGYRYNTLFGDMHAKSLTRDALDRAWATPL